MTPCIICFNFRIAKVFFLYFLTLHDQVLLSVAFQLQAVTGRGHVLHTNRIIHHHSQERKRFRVPYSPQLCLSSSPIPYILTSVVGGAAPTPFVTRAIQIWYKRISLPKYTPPDRIFAPVWTSLYATVGYSFWRTTQSLSTTSNIFSQRAILSLFIAHYLMNIAWAPIFFGYKNLRLGHALNVALILTLYILLPVLYLYVDTMAAWILIPYALWLAFATKLSHDICRLNPTDPTGYNNAKLEDDIYKLRREAGRKVGLKV